MRRLQPILAASAILSTAAQVRADDPPKTDAESITRGTGVFDAETVKALFRETKKKAEREAKERPVHLKIEEETVQLKAFRVDGDRVREDRALREKIEPDFDRRLERLSRVDPDAANELRVAQRNADEFFNGSRDPRPMGVAAPGKIEFDLEKLKAAADKIRRVLGGKRRDDSGN